MMDSRIVGDRPHLSGHYLFASEGKGNYEATILLHPVPSYERRLIGIHGTDILKKVIPLYEFIILRRTNELFAQHSPNTVGRAESTEPIVRTTRNP